MSNQTPTSSFPATQQDVSRLKQTATDAINDLSSTAFVHASRAKSQLQDLAGHVQEEGGEQLDQVKGKLSDLVDVARDFAFERPIVCIGAALALGFLIGFSRRGSSR
jgi:ElaB/YqjD/DUF883 family membrane-anchored ribosome-binding protein